MLLRTSRSCALALVLAVTVAAVSAEAGTLYTFTDVSGLSAEAEFTIVGGSGSTLEIRLRNTSTGAPVGFSNSDQILTGISWDFGQAGSSNIGDVVITGGSVVIGATSVSLNFDQVVTQLTSGADVSGEYGYGNVAGSGALTNFVSTIEALATPFGGPNLDATVNIDGPQAGLVSSAPPVPLGGLGAIQDEIVITLALGGIYTQSAMDADIAANGVRVEFGSDAFFINVPEPSTAVCLALGLVWLGGRRRMRRAPAAH